MEEEEAKAAKAEASRQAAQDVLPSHPSNKVRQRVRWHMHACVPLPVHQTMYVMDRVSCMHMCMCLCICLHAFA